MKTTIVAIDTYLIRHLHKLEVPLARFAIFVVYFWFGILKILDLSPAKPLVQALFSETLWFIPFEPFYIMFSIFEMGIGLLFLVRGAERLAVLFIFLHLITTMLPLIFLSNITWQGVFVPTLEGQYIIKNVLIAASAVVVGSKLVPMKKST